MLENWSITMYLKKGKTLAQYTGSRWHQRKKQLDEDTGDTVD